MFVPLLVSSCYSFHFGTLFPRDLVRCARELGYAALSLTDRNGVYGIPAFLETCEDEGIRPLMGTELTERGLRALLIARTRAGWSRICRLLTARAEGCFDLAAALLDETEKGPCVLGEGAPNAAAVSPTAPPDLYIASDDRVLLEASRGRMYALLTPGTGRASCGTVWRSLSGTGAPPLAAGEVRYLAPGDREVQRLLVAIGSGRTKSEIQDTELSQPGALLVPPEAALKPYAGLPEALRANEALSQSIEFSSIFDGYVFPRYRAGDTGGSAALLRTLVDEGARKRYGGVEGVVRDRMEYELAIIEAKSFSDYFLVVRDIVRKTGRTCGRGSAAASLVSYSLGITDVDPLAHGLYFERFLNPGRQDPPDIDVDFAWDERDAILASVIEDFGPDRAARVANHVCFQARSALRETARAFGMPDGEIGAVERDFSLDREKTMTGADPAWREILELAPRIAGFPRHLGVHSGGLIIVPDRLTDRVPVEKSGSGIRVTAWDKEGVEAAGLVKIDLLGNRSLAVVRDALANLRENGIPLDEDAWEPLSDTATIDLLARGDTMGVFYVESPAMRLLQKKSGKGDFEHLVIHSSMIRPAANRYINEYLDRLAGKPYEPLHPLLDGLLSETYGILCYQEDVSKTAIALAGFTPSEADGIRKVLSKKDVHTRLSAYRRKFEEGARARGVEASVIAEAWEMIESFAGYSFVKAHSASYAQLSFRSAYLRAHHGAEFMAAVMSNRGGFYSTLAYASESRRMGFRLLPPDVNESEIRCRGREGAIRFGLGMIASLGSAPALAIIEERLRNGRYTSVEDFGRRVRVDRSAAESLVGSGALDALGGGQSRADSLLSLLSQAANGEAASGTELFAVELESGSRRRRSVESPRRRLETQMRYLGTTLDDHPLKLCPRALARPRTLGRELPGLAGRYVELVAWPITAKPVLTAAEEPMEFVSFEDETALYEAVLFPEAYRRCRPLLYQGGPLIVRGLVQEDRGATVLTVKSLEKIEWEAGRPR